MSRLKLEPCRFCGERSEFRATVEAEVMLGRDEEGYAFTYGESSEGVAGIHLPSCFRVVLDASRIAPEVRVLIMDRGLC